MVLIIVLIAYVLAHHSLLPRASAPSLVPRASVPSLAGLVPRASGSSPVMEAALRERIAEVRKPGRYLGFLEWVAWAYTQRWRVLMLYGSAVWDIVVARR